MTENLAIQYELGTVQSTKETVAVKREEQIIVESIAKSNACLQSEENPSPRFVVIHTHLPYLVFICTSFVYI